MTRSNAVRKATPLEMLAIEVAICAPRQFSKYGTAAYIPRKLVQQIRDELGRLGFDWETPAKARRTQRGLRP